MDENWPSEEIYAKIKKIELIVGDAPKQDKDILEVWLKRWNIPLPVPVKFQYNPGDELDKRWKDFRAEVVIIPAEKHVPFWYPWITKKISHKEMDLLSSSDWQTPEIWKSKGIVPEEVSGVETFRKNRTDTIESTEMPEYQAIIRFRVWKQGQAESDGFLEMMLEPNPDNHTSYRQQTSIRMYNPTLPVRSLQEFLKLIKDRQSPGPKPDENYLEEMKEAFQHLKPEFRKRRRISQQQLAREMYITERTLQNRIKDSGKKWDELYKWLEDETEKK